MTTAKITVGVVLVAGALAIPIILQQQALRAARAEHAALEARLRGLPEPPASAPPGLAKTDDSAQRSREDLERLRLEVTTLKTRISEITVEVQQASVAQASNAAAAAAKKGAAIAGTLKPREARDVGQATPAAMLQTFLSSVMSGDTNRLVQLLEFDPATDPAIAQRVVYTLSQMGARSSDPNAGLPEEIRAVEEQAGETNDHWLVTETVEKGGRLHRDRVKVRQTDAGWKVMVGSNGEPVTQSLPNQP